MGLSGCGRHATEVVWTSRGCNAVAQKAAEPLRESEIRTTGFPAVVAGFVPAIHGLLAARKTWMPATSARMNGREGRPAGASFPALQQRAIAPRALEQLQEDNDRDRKIGGVERKCRDHQVGAEHLFKDQRPHALEHI